MKIKKRFIVLCIVLSVAALAISVAMFYFEMGLAHFSKLDKVITGTWKQTSSADPAYGNTNTNYIVTKIRTLSEARKESQADPTRGEVASFPYLGTVRVCDGKYKAYGQDVYGNNFVIYGDPRNSTDKENDKTSEGKVREFGFGSRTSVYYKPDDPRRTATRVGYTQYIVFIAVLVVLAIGLVVLAKFINEKLKESTFDESPVTIMDIPALVVIIGIILGFLSGLFIGNISVGADYTIINQNIANLYETGEISVT